MNDSAQAPTLAASLRLPLVLIREETCDGFGLLQFEPSTSGLLLHYDVEIRMDLYNNSNTMLRLLGSYSETGLGLLT